jgi:hypothetical protein
VRALALGALVLALAACSGGEKDKGGTAQDYAQRTGVDAGAPAVSVAEVNAQPVKPSAGSSVLTPLAANAPTVLGKIKGGCTFAYQDRTLLSVGAPDTTDATGKGVLVIDGRQVILPGIDAGGPQVIESGPTLTGDGLTVAVQRAEGAPESVAGGGHRWAADLVVKGPTGETRYSPGTWTCAP